MLQDIPAVCRNPGHEISDYTFLPPAPFLAAPAALPAVLSFCHDRSVQDYSIKRFNLSATGSCSSPSAGLVPGFIRIGI
jgi:hypothetical protein